MELLFRLDDLRGAEVQELLESHLADLEPLSPPESRHALDLDGLRAPDVTFWSVWSETALVGIGALKELDRHHGEIKSMHTAFAMRGRGIAARILEHIMEKARRRGYLRLSLETGSMAAMAPARALYEKFGFVACPPFANYHLDPNSTFMTCEL